MVAVLGAELDDGPGAPAGAGVGETDRLEGAVAQGVDPPAGYLLDGLTRLEEIGGLEVLGGHTLGVHERLVESLVLLAAERRVEIVGSRTLAVP